MAGLNIKNKEKAKRKEHLHMNILAFQLTFSVKIRKLTFSVQLRLQFKGRLLKWLKSRARNENVRFVFDYYIMF